MFFFWKTNPSLQANSETGFFWVEKNDSDADGTALEEREQLSLWH